MKKRNKIMIIKLLLLTLSLIISNGSYAKEYGYAEDPVDQSVRNEFKISLEVYLKELSSNVGYFFTLNNRDCSEKKKLANLINTKVSISTDKNSSIYEHLEQLALDIGEEYRITLDLPLKTIELSCKHEIKGVKND
jgi:hypothetical protein